LSLAAKLLSFQTNSTDLHHLGWRTILNKTCPTENLVERENTITTVNPPVSHRDPVLTLESEHFHDDQMRDLIEAAQQTRAREIQTQQKRKQPRKRSLAHFARRQRIYCFDNSIDFFFEYVTDNGSRILKKRNMQRLFERKCGFCGTSHATRSCKTSTSCTYPLCVKDPSHSITLNGIT
jgi:hypothetical protein